MLFPFSLDFSSNFYFYDYLLSRRTEQKKTEEKQKTKQTQAGVFAAFITFT